MTKALPNPGMPEQLAQLACDIVAAIPDFQVVKGAGAGDHATAAFMRKLREKSTIAFGKDYSECKLCGETGFAVDFYFPQAETIVEVALGLPNPQSEFEKDILKAIMARESGHTVSRLLFISRAGATKKCQQPGRSAMRNWAREKHGLTIEVQELPGPPRMRVRKPKVSL